MNKQKLSDGFDFSMAITQLFCTQGGKGFAKRLWFWASAAYAAVMLVSFPFIIKYYPDLMEANWYNMKAVMEGRAPDNGALLSILPKILPSYSFLIVSMLIIGAVTETALHKKVLLGEDEQGIPLKFGGVQLRVLIVQLAVWAIWFLVYMFGVVLLSLFISAIAIVTPILAGILGVLSFIALMCFLVYLPVRLAPAAALSVKNNRFQIIGARKASKGVFWQLLGAYTAAFFCGSMLVYAVLSIGVVAVTGDMDFLKAMSGMGAENPKVAFAVAAERFKNPLVMFIGIVAIFAYAGAYAMYTLSISGISSYTVKWWSDKIEIQHFD